MTKVMLLVIAVPIFLAGRMAIDWILNWDDGSEQ